LFGKFWIRTHDTRVEQVPVLLRRVHVLPEPVQFFLRLLNGIVVNLSFHDEFALFLDKFGVFLRQLLFRLLPFLIRLRKLRF
jgi:hypothetical protein